MGIMTNYTKQIQTVGRWTHQHRYLFWSFLAFEQKGYRGPGDRLLDAIWDAISMADIGSPYARKIAEDHWSYFCWCFTIIGNASDMFLSWSMTSSLYTQIRLVSSHCNQLAKHDTVGLPLVKSSSPKPATRNLGWTCGDLDKRSSTGLGMVTMCIHGWHEATATWG